MTVTCSEMLSRMRKKNWLCVYIRYKLVLPVFFTISSFQHDVIPLVFFFFLQFKKEEQEYTEKYFITSSYLSENRLPRTCSPQASTVH